MQQNKKQRIKYKMSRMPPIRGMKILACFIVYCLLFALLLLIKICIVGGTVASSILVFICPPPMCSFSNQCYERLGDHLYVR